MIFAFRENEEYVRKVNVKRGEKTGHLNVMEYLWRVCYVRCKKGMVGPRDTVGVTASSISPIETDRPR